MHHPTSSLSEAHKTMQIAAETRLTALALERQSLRCTLYCVLHIQIDIHGDVHKTMQIASETRGWGVQRGGRLARVTRWLAGRRV